MKSCEGLPKVSGSFNINKAVPNPIAPGKIQESIPNSLEK